MILVLRRCLFVVRKGNVDIDDQVHAMEGGSPLHWNHAANLLTLLMLVLSHSIGFCLVAGGDLVWLVPAGLVEVRLAQAQQYLRRGNIAFMRAIGYLTLY